MLRIEEVKKVNSLLEQKRKYEKILRSFESSYIRTSIGLINIYSSSPKSPGLYEDAGIFDNCFGELVEKLNEITVKEISHKIKEIEIELSKYLEEE